ncbi:F-box LRR-repeat 15-like isoform A [Chlorella sorokiniana]|uniref:F-box LRR-repeat 15-like isoform A n=1 Tax=Chlorella sorokiniana TaxID=3076 RepID=A0A2P6U1E4_CHLSO|nr:F-box LRR-repeat 15-like isoform A [Chlorella sorokiniana]|eukprot:PRW60130.1 F-box LRR-repeat 15-like isoform A [Chlorella sorokiniana]
MPKTSSLAIDALPDGVLGDILAASGRPAGPAVTLVCRRWHRVYYEQPSIWRNLRLHVRPGPQQMWQTEVGCRVLRRVEGHVGLLSLVNPSCWPQQTTVSLDSLLDQLQLGRLAGLHYGYEVWSPSLAGLQPLSNQLTSLEVKLLVQLPSLRSLRLSGRAGSGIDILALPAPTDFPALQDCQYRGDGCQIQARYRWVSPVMKDQCA